MVVDVIDIRMTNSSVRYLASGAAIKPPQMGPILLLTRSCGLTSGLLEVRFEKQE